MKIFKILLLSLTGLLVLTAVAAAVAVKVFLSEDKIKTYITEYAKNNLNRQVEFDKLSFAFIGIDLKNFRISDMISKDQQQQTAKDNYKTPEAFVNAEHFTIKISPLPLLHKQIKISNLLLKSVNINIVKNKDGKFNFDDLTSKEKESADDTKMVKDNDGKNAWAVNIQNLNIKDANIKYKDEQNGIDSIIKNFSMSIKDFSFTEPFNCETSCDVDIKQAKLQITIPLSAKFQTYLANFDMEKILLNVYSLETKYNNALLNLSGKIKSINTPNVDCSITIKNINEKTFKDFVKLNKFNIDKVDFKTKTTINISSQNANIESLSLVLPNSSSNISGIVDWGKKDLCYNLKAELDLKYNGAEISLNGKAENKTNHSLIMNLKAKNITNDTAKDFYQCPIKFILPSLDISSALSFNLEKNTADITKLNIKIPDSFANISGKINWNNKKNFVYNLTMNLDFLLDNIAKSFPEYNIKGRIKSDAKVSNKDFSGTLNLNKVAFDYVPMAKISKLNVDAVAKSKNNIVIKNISGIFNEGNFKADGSLINNDIKFNLNMDKLTVKTSTVTTAKTQNISSSKEEKTAVTTTNAKKQEYYNIYTNINIDKINVPYLISKNATMKTSLKSFSSDMKKVDGLFSLVVSSGTITDVDKFAENKYAKLFLTIFNVLNNNISGSGNSKGIDYDSMTANVSFTDGLMRTNQVNIKIPLTTIDVTGTVNFKNEKVDMKVNTELYAAMKITGTVSNPKTTFDVASTAAQIIGGSKNLEEVGQKLGNSLKSLFK